MCVCVCERERGRERERERERGKIKSESLYVREGESQMTLREKERRTDRKNQKGGLYVSEIHKHRVCERETVWN